MAVRIYLAAPLFCEAELDYNKKLADALRMRGYDVILPQELGNDVKQMMINDPKTAYREIFDSDIKALKSCDILVMVMDGRVPDEGACVELGIAYCQSMECFGIKTDVRTSEYGTDNFMITGALKGRVAKDVNSLCEMIEITLKS